jgi:hypothetical protein
VISRPLAWFIALTLLIILAAAWWAGNYPARLTIINSSSTDVAGIAIDSGAQHVDIPSIANGAAKSTQLRPGAAVTIRTRATTWTSPNALTPGGAVVVYILPDGRIEARSRLGTLAR